MTSLSQNLSVEVMKERGSDAAWGSGREAEAAALHADLEAVSGLAAGVDDAAVHVARKLAVAAFFWSAAAAETRVVGGARAARCAVQHDVAQH